MWIVILVLAWMITKSIHEGRMDHTYAKQGLVSPRLQAKYGDGAKEKTSRYGLGDFLADAWSDNWSQRTEKRRAAREAAKTAGPAGAKKKVRWRDKLQAARQAITGGDKADAKTTATTTTADDTEQRRTVDPRPAHAVEEPDPWTEEIRDAFGDELDDDGYRLVRDRLCCWPVAARDGGGFVYCRADTKPGFIYCNPHLDENDRELDANARQVDAETEPAQPAGAAEPPVADRPEPRPVDPDPVAGYNPRHAEPDTDLSPDDPEEPTHAGGKPMTAPTGEAVNYETTVAELEAIAAEQRKQIDQAAAALKHVQDAIAAVDGVEAAYKATAEAAQSVNEHLAALHLDSDTLGHVGNAADAMPTSAVDAVLDHLEQVKAQIEAWLRGAEVALAATEQALATVQAKYADAAATVQGELSGDSRFLDGGGGSAAPAPATAAA